MFAIIRNYRRYKHIIYGYKISSHKMLYLQKLYHRGLRLYTFEM